MTDLVLRNGAPLADRAPARPIGHAASMRPADEALVLDLVTTVAGLEALEADWNALHARAGEPHHVFQTFNWCWHWCCHYVSGSRQLAIVTGRSEGRLVLLMPLAIQRRAGLVELTWLGEPVSQYGDILALPEACGLATLQQAWRFACSRTGADLANLRRVRADAFAADLLGSLGAKVTATEEAPFLDVSRTASFAEWETRRAPKGLKNRRRQARRLAEIGAVAFASHSGTPEAAALAAHAVRLKRETLGAKGAISLALADERFEAFFSAAAAATERPPGVRVLAVTTDGRPAALKILIDGPEASFLHVAVFVPGLEKCAPGALLLEHAVAETIRTGRKTLDLLPPRHEYKMDFADGVVAVHDHALAVSTAGWLYTNGFLRLRRSLKAVVEGLPLPVRRLLAKVAC
ncbi:MAG: GNAT family N-acetyltransferase [Hyphomicrobiaceae bacterium]